MIAGVEPRVERLENREATPQRKTVPRTTYTEARGGTRTTDGEVYVEPELGSGDTHGAVEPFDTAWKRHGRLVTCRWEIEQPSARPVSIRSRPGVTLRASAQRHSRQTLSCQESLPDMSRLHSLRLELSSQAFPKAFEPLSSRP